MDADWRSYAAPDGGHLTLDEFEQALELVRSVVPALQTCKEHLIQKYRGEEDE